MSVVSTVPPKNIVLFSDGTGNSAAKLFRTNVWRLYQAVDTGPTNVVGELRQIVTYDDGVGTSSFKPLALLGGAFGFGLEQNVLDLYRFICRTYEPGDRIYAFGFSRGAFTIRVLIGLLTTVGIIDARGMDHVVLNALSDDAYRDFRRCFRLGGNRQPLGEAQQGTRDRTDLFVTPLRDFRDRRVARSRQKAGMPILDPSHILEVPEVAFVGVWDTVAAYGSPIAEITKGIDRWVWPLSMPDYTLSDKVRSARHALALDDERDTFHPLLWDEVHERTLVAAGKVVPSRMRQVWFAGMHSDVGGGYPEESLAYVSLAWMAEEAVKAGLRLRAGTIDQFRAHADPLGPMHNSRAGFAAYYRYQPRKISARLARPDRTTRILQDPDFKGRGLLTAVRVHDSVLERIERGTDGYAPIVLPRRYQVEGGAPREKHPLPRAATQERVWDLVWRRRLHYFLTLAVTLALLALAALPPLLRLPSPACVGPQCFISPWLRSVGEFLPSFAAGWMDSFADRPGTFLVLAVSLVLLLRKTGRIELAMRDQMRRLFRLSLEAPSGAAAEMRNEARKFGCIRRLRSSRKYQASMQFLKWRAAPGVAAALIYAVAAVLAVTFLSSVLNVTHRAHIAYAERTEAFCRLEPPPPEYAESGERLFSTAHLCWPVEGSVSKGQRYRLEMQVEEPWRDGTIPASPAGFDTARFAWWARWPATLLRRSTSDPWFRPLVHVQGRTWALGAFQSVPMRLLDYENRTYVGEFIAPADGELILSVNDAVFLWSGRPDLFYKQGAGANRGTALVTLEACSAAAHPCDY
jgi:uncharacterized protein (DUF2235 family)